MKHTVHGSFLDHAGGVWHPSGISDNFTELLEFQTGHMVSSASTAERDDISDRWHAVTAGFLGWTLDAFDFFVVIFLFDVLAEHFHVAKSAIVLTVTATLAGRSVPGADCTHRGR